MYQVKPSVDAHHGKYKFLAELSDAGFGIKGNLLALGGRVLYGTTQLGGACGGGSIFRLIPKPGGWLPETLYAFHVP